MRRRDTKRPTLGWSLLASVASGAAGAVALNTTSYLDMLVRGRPASGVPATVAARITEAMGVSLGEGSAAANRSGALGGLLGNLTGVSVALGYGLARRYVRPMSLSSAALAVGASAMASTDLAAAATGATRPSGWGLADWVADVLPHAVYGLVAVAVHNALVRAGTPRGAPMAGQRPVSGR